MTLTDTISEAERDAEVVLSGRDRCNTCLRPTFTTGEGSHHWDPAIADHVATVFVPADHAG